MPVPPLRPRRPSARRRSPASASASTSPFRLACGTPHARRRRAFHVHARPIEPAARLPELAPAPHYTRLNRKPVSKALCSAAMRVVSSLHCSPLLFIIIINSHEVRQLFALIAEVCLRGRSRYPFPRVGAQFEGARALLFFSCFSPSRFCRFCIDNLSSGSLCLRSARCPVPPFTFSVPPQFPAARPPHFPAFCDSICAILRALICAGDGGGEAMRGSADFTLVSLRRRVAYVLS